ncbi:alpha/beta hydrolase [Rhodopirellula sp. P2]|uniref:alpha/beta hydrolase n=1 Tax=Rhodopirellula sp. P2 TaxID=2127060 RepID=UPI002368C5E3|nr:alpha/beta hydrolase [Rhodopirellula sp. P2]WDQ15052.1 alpha/beta hydrolase [Rhodopirellula sp. P2]
MPNEPAADSDQSNPANRDLDQRSSASADASTKAKPTVRRRILRTSALLAVIYVMVCLGLVVMETRLLFPGAYFDTGILMDPNRFTPDRPTPGVVETMTYPAVDGADLEGRLLIRDSADDVILFLHGNGIHADEMDDWTRRLSDSWNATVLTAEYRGFQGDGFTPSETSTIEDAVSAIDALSDTTGTPVSEIIVYGRSLGGGIACGLVAALHDRGESIDALLLDRTFDSAASVGADRFFFLPVRWLMKNQYDSVQALQNYDGVLVQIHGSPDRIVPRKNGRALYDSLTLQHSDWIELPDMFHNDRLPTRVLDQSGRKLKALREQAFPENKSPASDSVEAPTAASSSAE